LVNNVYIKSNFQHTNVHADARERACACTHIYIKKATH